MKIIIISEGDNTLTVYARNLDTCKTEMLKRFPEYEFKFTVHPANQISGSIGEYLFNKKVIRNEI